MHDTELTRPNIFSYNNFRFFLRDLYDYKRTINKHFTKSYICKALGLPNSRSYFGDILSGKKLSNEKIPHFSKVFKLQKDESLYFRVLVNYNQSSSREDKEIFLEQLISLNRTPKEIIKPEIYSYYKNWYNPVIRAILGTYDFSDNYKELANKIIPHLNVPQVRASINLLLNLQLIAKDENGYLKPTQKVISTGSCIANDLIAQFQIKSIDNGLEIISSNKNQNQKVLTKVVSFSENVYEQITKKISKFNKEVTSIIHKDEMPAESVYHLDLLFYPVSNKDK